jgi:hypothetical protein
MDSAVASCQRPVVVGFVVVHGEEAKARRCSYRKIVLYCRNS